MEKSMLTEVKAILKSLVLSCPEKITVEKLNRDYRDVEGQNIPFRQLGYGSLEQFLHSVPDTLRVFGSGPTAMVCFVANKKSEHIHDMIMRQKKPKSKPQKPNRVSYNRSNAVHAHNWQKPSKLSGQQLSPYQNVTRNQMTKTLQIKPQVPAFYNFPQPNGILLQSNVCTINRGIVQHANAKNHSLNNNINQLSSAFKSQCGLSTPPPPLPSSQARHGVLAAEKKSVQAEATAKTEPEKEKFRTVEETLNMDTKAFLMQIKPPTSRKQVSIKLSHEIADMPKLTNSASPIKEPLNSLRTEASEPAESIKNVKTSRPTEARKCFEDSTDRIEDEDEAIPSFAAKMNVFLLDFPENSVPYGNKIAPCKLPDEIKVDSKLKIFITEIHSPFKFWFHIYKENNELDLLMYQIERYYLSLQSEDLCFPQTCLTPGQVCAAMYNGMWHRAEIVSPPLKKSIKVFFMDYGTVAEVELEKIKFLPSSFAQLPAQALRGCLSHIKPTDYHWTHEATVYFLSLVEELMLYANVTEINKEKNVLYMVLCDTNGEAVININSSLVENHYAMFNEDWRTEIIKQHGKRLHHPREDFPTFSMIESGEYPSFTELGRLLEQGIDYETIYDTAIFNQASILNKHESASEGLKKLPYPLMTSNPFRWEILRDLYATASRAL